jgi:acyl carrier protein phosphodiesterase
MNWLAHVFLSPQRIDYQLGNMLADTTKGRCWLPPKCDLCRGMRLHAQIDAFTDAHPKVREAKKSLAPRGALKGVALDILFDHFLSVHWERFCSVKRERFLRRFRSQALRACRAYPKEAKETVRRVVETQHLQTYATMDGVKQAFIRIDNRLSSSLRKKDGMMVYLPLIGIEREALEAAFLSFFPDLMAFTAEQAPDEDFEHWRMS